VERRPVWLLEGLKKKARKREVTIVVVLVMKVGVRKQWSSYLS
jgi:hypothetical protein